MTWGHSLSKEELARDVPRHGLSAEQAVFLEISRNLVQNTKNQDYQEALNALDVSAFIEYFKMVGELSKKMGLDTVRYFRDSDIQILSEEVENELMQRSYTDAHNYINWTNQIAELTSKNNVLLAEIDNLKKSNITIDIVNALVNSGTVEDYFKNAGSNLFTLLVNRFNVKTYGPGVLVDPTIVPDVYSIIDNSKNIILDAKSAFRIAREIRSNIEGGIIIRQSLISSNNDIILYCKYMANTHYFYDDFGQIEYLTF
ncbi:hypothetical protein AGMMS49579_13540 [Spirochaetia bacterium]|nr:hypothetical protein AGMMS49579_13540 [Spirochaetia bacterium]